MLFEEVNHIWRENQAAMSQLLSDLPGRYQTFPISKGDHSHRRKADSGDEQKATWQGTI